MLFRSSSIKKLRTLRLSHNKINTANSYNHLAEVEKLKFLWLDNNAIKQLPPEIGNLKQVVELYLEDNQLSQLPEAIKQCENLCILYLGNNQFKEIPSQIMDMKMMYMLVLYNNQIETIPEEFAHATAPLAVLIMDKNKLSEAEINKSINYFKGFFLFSTKNQYKPLPFGENKKRGYEKNTNNTNPTYCYKWLCSARPSVQFVYV